MRIYKGSEITLRLYNPCKIEDGLVDVVLYTTNPKLAYKVKDATVEGNIVYVKIDKFTFNNMEDGVINYIILDEVYNTERQSSYYLKTPDDYIAKSVQTSKNIDIVDNGDYKILPDEDYSSIEEVNVHVEFDAEPYIQRGFELGIENQKSKLESISITENGTYSREDGYNEITVEVPDLNGSFDEGYQQGKEDGYNTGKQEQKELLEHITITENGVYSRENGYSQVTVEVPDLNGSFDEGYQAGIDYASENAEEIAAANAIDLVVTEHKTYYTKYSDNIVYPEVTGVFPNGENFYNYATLNGIVYDTGIVATQDMKYDFWWRTDGSYTRNAAIIGIQDGGNMIMKICEYGTGSQLRYEYGMFAANSGSFDIILDGWNHIIMSKAEGLIVNDVKIADFTADWYGEVYPNVYINAAYDGEIKLNGNGDFGMIKITTNGIEQVIIPTENGLFNNTTGELLTIAKDGEYRYVNAFPTILPNLIKSVDVQTKINVAAIGLKFGYSTFTEVPSWADFSNTTDMSGLFNSCSKLQSFPQIDTSNVLKMMNLFYGCSSLQTIPLLNTSKVTNMEALFAQCTSLIAIPQLDTSSAQNLNQTFYHCTSLTSIPPLKADNLNMPETYRGIFGYTELTKLTDFGGLIGLKCRLIGDYNFTKLPNLTYQSCINILNGLYDFVGNGKTPTSNQGQLKVHPNFLTTVGDEISIGVLKGWSIQS